MRASADSGEATSGTGTSLGPLVIAYGTQSGNAQYLSIGAEKRAAEFGFETRRVSMDEIRPSDLLNVERLLLIMSTYNDAEFPDSVVDFWEELQEDTLSFEGLKYAVLGLGDSMYEDFCWASEQFDLRLERMGATRLVPRADCDIDFDETSVPWLAHALAMFVASVNGTASTAASTSDDLAHGDAAPVKAREASRWNRTNPFPAKILEARRLSGAGSSKRVFHLELDLSGSDLVYEPGDSVSVVISNQPALVDQLIDALGVRSDDEFSAIDGSVRAALTNDLEIRLPTRHLVEVVAAAAGSEELSRVLSYDHEKMERWLWAQDALDILRRAPAGSVDPNEFLGALGPLAHRTYSISSSPLVRAEQVGLTISLVQYEQGNRRHHGAASAYLEKCIEESAPVDIFLSPNPTFRSPAAESPIIMIGPGTGIAPFRSFIQHRSEQGATGESWLFFGDRTSVDDWLYKEEMLAAVERGLLTRLTTAFSRDQQVKRYVQHEMLAASKEFYAWMEAGAYIYVCGDMKSMAKDVELALLEIVTRESGRSLGEAKAFLDDLRASRHYQLDVY